jgi:hypothetical protein
LAID